MRSDEGSERRPIIKKGQGKLLCSFVVPNDHNDQSVQIVASDKFNKRTKLISLKIEGDAKLPFLMGGTLICGSKQGRGYKYHVKIAFFRTRE